MPYVHPAWLEHQRKRFTRENAYLYIRPDADRLLGPQARHLLPPNWRRPGDRYADRAAPDTPEAHSTGLSAETEALRFRAEIAAIRFELALLKAARFFRKYSPDQPRVPAGNPDGGQWTSEEGGGGLGYSAGPAALSGSSAGNIVLSQIEVGTLLGQAIIHPTRGGGKDCFYQFSYGIVAVRWSANLPCSQTLPWFAVTHGRLIK